MNSAHDNVITNKPICNVQYKLIATFYPLIFFLSIRVRMSWNIGDDRNLFLKLNSKMGHYHVVHTKPKEILPQKFTLTLIELRQLPDFEKMPSKSGISCLKWTIYNGRKLCVRYQKDTEELNIVVYRD